MGTLTSSDIDIGSKSSIRRSRDFKNSMRTCNSAGGLAAVYDIA